MPGLLPPTRKVHWGEFTTYEVDSHKDEVAALNQTRAERSQAIAEVRAEEWWGARAPSRIILVALSLILLFQEIAAMSMPLGFSAWQGVPGYPDQGNCVKDGADHFADIDALLDKAIPSGWQGNAADAYLKANLTLKNIAQQMVELDRELEKLVQSHAKYVSSTQLALGVTQDTVIPIYAAVWNLEMYPTSYLVAMYISCFVSSLAIMTGTISLYSCFQHADETADKAKNMTYADITQAADEVSADPVTPSGQPVTATSHTRGSADLSQGVDAPAANPSTTTVAALSDPIHDFRPAAQRRATSSPSTRFSVNPRPPSNRAQQPTGAETRHPSALKNTHTGAGTHRSERAPIDDDAPELPGARESNSTNTAENSCPS